MDLSPRQYEATLIAYSFELVADIILAFLSTLVLQAVLRCRVIHMNLRLLLACKCLSSVVYGCNRSTFLIMQMRKDSFDPSSPALTGFFSHVCASFNNYLSVVYTSERILATIYVKTYEKQKPFYGTGCALLLLIVTAYNAGADNLWRSASAPVGSSYVITTYLTIYGTNVCGFLCIGIVYWLLQYNLKSYKHQMCWLDASRLTQRYQRSENVRTTRHLMPVIFLHSLSGLVGAGYVTAFAFFTSPGSRFGLRIALYLSNCVIYNLCQLAVLYYHPTLRREAGAFLRCIRRTLRCSHKPSSITPTASAIERLSGGRLIEDSPDARTEMYFNNLTSSWERHYDLSLHKNTDVRC